MASYLTSESQLYAYVSQDLLNRLLDDDDDADVDSSILSSMIDAVEAKFHSFVARRYSVPITDANGIIVARDYCGRLFEYYAFARRQATTEEIQSRYERTLGELKAVRDGNLALWDPPPDEATTQGGQYTATELDRDMTPVKLTGWGGGSTRQTDTTED